MEVKYLHRDMGCVKSEAAWKAWKKRLIRDSQVSLEGWWESFLDDALTAVLPAVDDPDPEVERDWVPVEEFFPKSMYIVKSRRISGDAPVAFRSESEFERYWAKIHPGEPVSLYSLADNPNTTPDPDYVLDARRCRIIQASASAQYDWHGRRFAVYLGTGDCLQAEQLW